MNANQLLLLCKVSFALLFCLLISIAGLFWFKTGSINFISILSAIILLIAAPYLFNNHRKTYVWLCMIAIILIIESLMNLMSQNNFHKLYLSQLFLSSSYFFSSCLYIKKTALAKNSPQTE